MKTIICTVVVCSLYIETWLAQSEICVELWKCLDGVEVKKKICGEVYENDILHVQKPNFIVLND